MLRGLRTFSDALGLSTNANKSNIFGTNMTDATLTDLVEISGFARGSLPFRYRGVPITACEIYGL